MKAEHSYKKKLRAVLVDDEEIACRNLEQLLADYVAPPLEICGVAHDTREAEVLIRAVRPDVVFMDIEMPNEDAFGLLERMSPYEFEVIFITAYDQYAIKALRLSAFDYILKPVNIAELADAVGKLQQVLRVGDEQRLHRTVRKDEISSINRHQIALRTQQSIEIVAFSDIVFLEGLGGYSRFYYYKGKELKNILMSHPILDYEAVLPTEMFFRIHKSYLINCCHISGIDKGDVPFAIVTKEVRLPISRRRYHDLMQFLNANMFRYG